MAGIQETGSSPAPRPLFGKGSTRRRVGIRIDMTPMVDIAFLLLIFFMVTTVFRQPRAIELNVPKMEDKVAVPENNVLTVYIDQHEGMYTRLGTGPLSRTDLDHIFDGLKQQAAANPNLIILVKISRQARYEHMVNMLDGFEDAHLERFSLAVLDDADAKLLEGTK
jgi:biopolymer transport protein ExbD